MKVSSDSNDSLGGPNNNYNCNNDKLIGDLATHMSADTVVLSIIISRFVDFVYFVSFC